MKAFFALSCLVAVAYAKPGVILNGAIPWNGVAPVAAYSAGTPLSSQYHAQDELGQYSYGYAAGPSAKHETKTADGVTRGSFSYVDSHGLVQSRSYVSDPVHGFRVAASDLPVGPAPVAAPVAVAAAPVAVAAAPVAAPVHVAALPNPVADTVEVAAAKAQHFAAVAEARARNGDGVVIADAAPVAVAAAPVAVAAAPVAVAAAPAVAGLNSQYHAQDELGQYSYGYAGGLSAKNEQKTADGITRGSYSYVDAHGLVQSRSYVSDPVHGFRVAASDLPVGPAPVAAPIYAPAVAAAPVYAPAVAAAPVYAPAVAAAPVAAPVVAAPAVVSADDTVVVGGSPADTPEVAAAKAAHFAAHHEARVRLANAY